MATISGGKFPMIRTNYLLVVTNRRRLSRLGDVEPRRHQSLSEWLTAMNRVIA
jgi:hypothetical protein